MRQPLVGGPAPFSHQASSQSPSRERASGLKAARAARLAVSRTGSAIRSAGCVTRGAWSWRRAYLDQQRLAQHAILAPRLQDRVGPAPLRKGDRDLARAFSLLSDKASRTDARPVQVGVQRDDAQRAVILRRCDNRRHVRPAASSIASRRCRGPAVRLRPGHWATRTRSRRQTGRTAGKGEAEIGGEAEAPGGLPLQRAALRGPAQFPGFALAHEPHPPAERARLDQHQPG